MSADNSDRYDDSDEATMAAIIRDLRKCDPVFCDWTLPMTIRCSLCKVVTTYEVIHEASCPYRRALEFQPRPKGDNTK